MATNSCLGKAHMLHAFSSTYTGNTARTVLTLDSSLYVSAIAGYCAHATIIITL
jgi:hypothetical protein